MPHWQTFLIRECLLILGVDFFLGGGDLGGKESSEFVFRPSRGGGIFYASLPGILNKSYKMAVFMKNY